MQNRRIDSSLRCSLSSLLVALFAGAASGQDMFTSQTVGAGMAGTTTAGLGEHAGGAAWIDYNGDYLPDLFVTNGFGLDHFLFRNEGDGTFSNQSGLVPKPDLQREEVGAKFADIDNDGDSDLLVIVDNPEILVNPGRTGGPNLLYRNLGDGTFIEDGIATGIVDPLGSRNICGGFADYDRDGFIDLFIGRWIPTNPAGLTNFDRILKNDGTGIFLSDTASTRVDGYGRSALTCVWFDIDDDQWPDLYIGNSGRAVDGVEIPDNNDLLYSNWEQGGRFCDCSGDPRLFGDDASLPRGATVGDIDNDGDLDLYITDTQAEGPAPFGNVLYRNDGEGTFGDNSCDVAGICASDSWGTGFADFDRDGWLDLWVGSTDSAALDRLYLNDGDGTFTEAIQTAFIGNRNRGGSQADYDADGDVDIVMVNQGQDIQLLRNDAINGNRWLSLRLIGTTSNRDAIGAVVTVTANGTTMTRVVSGGDGAHSQPELTLHFGCGGDSTADVDVTWPSGQTTSITSLFTNRFRLIDEAAGLLTESLTSSVATWSSSTNELFVQAESSYGGRTAPSVTGFGALDYSAADVSWSRTFGGVGSNPGNIILALSFGVTEVLSVTTIP